jgi:uracil-DNA glycosylase family 4
MTAFDEALNSALEQLSRLRDEVEVEPRATRAALDRLLDAVAAPASPAVLMSAPVQRVPGDIAPASGEESAQSATTGLSAVSTFDELRAAVMACTRCPKLVAFRTNVVFGVGNPHAELMFVGEAPGADEDAQGEPFVGRAGQLLTRIIGTMEYAREEVYIANVLKCRPDMPPGSTGNRAPTAEEMAACLPYLRRQIQIIRPRIIVALGATAMNGLFGNVRPMREVRGKWHEFEGIPVMATYHPAYLLRNQSIAEKRKVWEDMLQVLEKLGKPITEKQRGFFLPK